MTSPRHPACALRSRVTTPPHGLSSAQLWSMLMVVSSMVAARARWDAAPTLSELLTGDGATHGILLRWPAAAAMLELRGLGGAVLGAVLGSDSTITACDTRLAAPGGGICPGAGADGAMPVLLLLEMASAASPASSAAPSGEPMPSSGAGARCMAWHGAESGNRTTRAPATHSQGRFISGMDERVQSQHAPAGRPHAMGSACQRCCMSRVVGSAHSSAPLRSAALRSPCPCAMHAPTRTC